MTDKQYIVMKERAEGNDRVGTAWVNTYTFNPTDTLEHVFEVLANFGEDQHNGRISLSEARRK